MLRTFLKYLKKRPQMDDLNTPKMMVLLRTLATKRDLRLFEYHEKLQMSLAKPSFLECSNHTFGIVFLNIWRMSLAFALFLRLIGFKKIKRIKKTKKIKKTLPPWLAYWHLAAWFSWLGVSICQFPFIFQSNLIDKSIKMCSEPAEANYLSNLSIIRQMY